MEVGRVIIDTQLDHETNSYGSLCVLAGNLKLDELIIHQFQLKDINLAFFTLEKGNVGRAILEL